ncbi:NAD-dependent epimerase/dehydratase family protein [Mucilaginibacter sp. dw_454]|uniref:NAD-dependent epimerase/dehydratase family protein n=1 Tax=Mucilaginibacter sp. dw_454 TaxID=2720079 RepID=UPI001BD1E06E|nr:NAD-dependent epimerase/dehydratase family protein [Mucilaginibacter sp. dw_454]
MAKNEVILIIGAKGQIGTELTVALRNKYGKDAVIATDLLEPNSSLLKDGPYMMLNVMEKLAIENIVTRYKVTTIYHLAAVLSASGEKKPSHAWSINMLGLMNVLDVAKIFGLKVFWPSSIAVFGPTSPKILCPQHTVTEPTTVYGITKFAGEQLCNYYHEQYGVDVRSLRYPGLISYTAKPGGGTTDYAVDIFHQALEKGNYTCFLKEETTLPMMYMADAVRAALELMEVPADRVKIRTAYNISAMSFSPKNLAAAINKHLPDFIMHYKPDERQKIADSWPRSIEFITATSDWGWQPQYDLHEMVADMLKHISKNAAC